MLQEAATATTAARCGVVVDVSMADDEVRDDVLLPETLKAAD